MTEGLQDVFSAVYISCLDAKMSSFVSPVYSTPVQDPPARPLCLAVARLHFPTRPLQGPATLRVVSNAQRKTRVQQLQELSDLCLLACALRPLIACHTARVAEHHRHTWEIRPFNTFHPPLHPLCCC